MLIKHIMKILFVQDCKLFSGPVHLLERSTNSAKGNWKVVPTSLFLSSREILNSRYKDHVLEHVCYHILIWQLCGMFNVIVVYPFWSVMSTRNNYVPCSFSIVVLYFKIQNYHERHSLSLDSVSSCIVIGLQSPWLFLFF